MNWPDSFLNWPVFFYLLIVVAAQILLQIYLQIRQRELSQRRRKAGLPKDLIMFHTIRLEKFKKRAGYEAALLLATIFITPLVMLAYTEDKVTKGGLLAVFVVMLAWLLLQGTQVAKAFLGGLAFKTMAAFKNPFQIGDRVTLKGSSGKITDINTFFVTLQTADDDQVSIPTHQLWSEVLISTNAGEKSSLCAMEFHLAPFVNKMQRQKAEDLIWDSIQASAYCETAKPMQIYISQKQDAVCLTAKAYVTNTYDEPVFRSDVYRAFLDFAHDAKIPLAAGQYRFSKEILEDIPNTGAAEVIS